MAALTPVMATDRQLHEIQHLLRAMMADLYQLSEPIGVKLYLGGGTALGGVRHKGFIPWDDDVDLNITRADYDRLLPYLMQPDFQEKYAVLTPSTGNGYAKTCTQIRLRGTVMRCLSDLALPECGVCVDLFVIENLPDNPLLQFFYGLLCSFMGLAVQCTRRWRDRKMLADILRSAPPNQVSGIPEGRGWAMKGKLALGALLSFASASVWSRWADNVYSMFGNRKSKMTSIISGKNHFFGERMFRESLGGERTVAFDGLELPVYKDVEGYLQRLYGAVYMAVPEGMQREQHCYFELCLPGDVHARKD